MARSWICELHQFSLFIFCEFSFLRTHTNYKFPIKMKSVASWVSPFGIGLFNAISFICTAEPCPRRAIVLAM